MNFDKMHTVKVERVKGGWIIDWTKPREEGPLRTPSFPVPSPLPTSGREIVTTRKDLIARLKELI